MISSGYTQTSETLRVMKSLIELEAFVKEVHWNTKGAGFISVHRYLDEVYASCEEYIDEIAEHLVSFFGTKPRWQAGGHQHFNPDESTFEDSINQVVYRIDDLLKLVDSIEEVRRETEDILVRLSQDFRLHIWFLMSELS